MKNNRMRLTTGLAKALEPEGAEYVVWDTEVAGFGLRVTTRGAKSFLFKYRAGHGRTATIRKPTIGKLGDLTVDHARKIAADWKILVKAGKDPSSERMGNEAEPTLKALVTEFLNEHAASLRTEDEYRRRVQRALLPKLGRKRISEITFAEVDKFRRSLADRPYEANRTIALLSKAFNYARRRKPYNQWIDRNPCDGIEKFPEHRRERYLTKEEISRVLEACDAYVAEAAGGPEEDRERRLRTVRRQVIALKLLMLTGARTGEVLSATRDQFDLKAGVWSKPAASTKQKKPHRTPLSPAAVELVEQTLEMLSEQDRYLFPTHRPSTRPHITNIDKAWRKIRAMAELEDCRKHDLRHTFASLLASDGKSLPIIGALLGHTQAQTTQRYAHLLDAPLRDAVASVASAYEVADH